MSGVTVKFAHVEEPIAIDDIDALLEACDRMVAGDLVKVGAHMHSKLLRQVLAALHMWHIQNGATIYTAHMLGYEGVKLRDVVAAHNFVGEQILNKSPIELPPRPSPDGEGVTMDVDAQDPEPVLEGEDAP